MEHETSPSDIVWRAVVACGIVALLAAGAGWAYLHFTQDAPEDVMLQAWRAFEDKDFRTAGLIAEEVLSTEPENNQALLMAGFAAANQQRFEEAVDFFNEIPDSYPDAAVDARTQTGRILAYELRDLPAAISMLERAVDLDPQSDEANVYLALLYGVSGRGRDAELHRINLIRLEQIDTIQLYLLSQGGESVENASMLEGFYRITPEDPGILLGKARNTLQNRDFEQADKFAQKSLEKNPDLLEASVIRGQVALAQENLQAFADWSNSLSEVADGNSSIWILRAQFAERTEQPQAAMRCFWESLKLDPNNQLANYRLGQLLAKTDRAEDAEAFLQRASQLQQYSNLVTGAVMGKFPGAFEGAVTKARALGLTWETRGWAQAALKEPRVGDSPWALQAIDDTGKLLHRVKTSRTDPDSFIAKQIDLAALPLPDNKNFESQAHSAATDEIESRVRFEDLSESAGINFQFFNSGKPKDSQQYMHETTGGGVGIIDFDNDHWPDIYLTQGVHWPPSETASDFSDTLFRNRGDGSFERANRPAGIHETRFSQGVTVGDFDNDGFQDIFVANIANNRLYRNNGDGTFVDWTSRIPSDFVNWTTACVMADFNGDGLPDVFATNYLAGMDVFSRQCTYGTLTSTCTVHYFSGTQDQIWVNLGDGTFKEMTNTTGIITDFGRGLGLVAADFDDNGNLDLYIGNDGEANLLFQNTTKADADRPAFFENGLLTGVALSGQGSSQSSHGIATGDVNSDGRLDVFMTNYYMESDTLLIQGEDGTFTDATRAAGLELSGQEHVRFGTQFIDADLDGHLDLLTTGGDVGRFPDPKRSYFGKPLFFQNSGEGTFSRVSAASLGTYFAQQHLGRGMAKLDWNRDGRQDIVVSHLDQQTALLTNQTEKTNHSLQIRLVGVKSPREAIGATVIAKAQERRWTQQLTAGDGYFSSNQHLLTLGLGQVESLDELQIRWPSGEIDTYSNIPVDHEVMIIEGHSEIHLMPNVSP
ncbi:MAG: FG-GAP-like repeat-containing protein [Pirellulaceae bacterium]|nr:FG-GAP-like repeat-containing protein [Pirellulaceae bacterium]